jgi:phage shock protein C
MEQQRRLYRSEANRMLAGVCGGLGEFFGLDPTLVRVGFVVLAFTPVGLPLYLVMWLIVPRHSKLGDEPAAAARDAVDEFRDRARRGGEELREAYERWREPEPPASETDDE